MAGYVIYSYTHRSSSSSGTASTVTGGAATTGSPQYLVPVVQDTTTPNATSTPPPTTTTTTPTTTTTTTTTPSGEQGLRLVGAGYYSTNNPGGYQPIASAATYEALLSAKTPMFYQPAPGVFQPLPTAIEGKILEKGTYGNTPVFIK